MQYDHDVNRFGMDLSSLSILILTSCVLVTVSLLPKPTGLAQKTSTEVNTLLEKGNALSHLGNYTQAIQYYDKVLAIQPKNIGALNNKGLSLSHLGHYTQAIEYFDKVLAIDPKNVNVLDSKGLALDKLGDHVGAIQYYDKVLAIQPKYSVNTVYNKGVALDKLGDHVGAIQYYDKVLAIQPKNVDALNNKGNILRKLGNNLEAIKYYQKAIEILKSNQSNQSTSGYSHTSSSVAAAIPHYKDAVVNQDFNEKLIIIQINYAKSLVNIGQYQLAITTYTEILQKDPYNGCALLNKADALYRSGQHEEAAKDYDTVKKLKLVCNVGATNMPKKAHQPSQLGALMSGLSRLFSH